MRSWLAWGQPRRRLGEQGGEESAASLSPGADRAAEPRKAAVDSSEETADDASDRDGRSGGRALRWPQPQSAKARSRQRPDAYIPRGRGGAV